MNTINCRSTPPLSPLNRHWLHSFVEVIGNGVVSTTSITNVLIKGEQVKLVKILEWRDLNGK